MTITQSIIVFVIFSFLLFLVIAFIYATYEIGRVVKKEPQLPERKPVENVSIKYDKDFKISFQLMRTISNSIALTNEKIIDIKSGTYTNSDIANTLGTIYLIDKLYKTINQTINNIFPYDTAFQIYFDSRDTIYFPIVVKRLNTLAKGNYCIMIKAYYIENKNEVNITPLLIKNLGFDFKARYIQLNIGERNILKI